MVHTLVFCEIYDASNVALFWVLLDLNPTLVGKLPKSSGYFPEILPKWLNVATNQFRFGAKISFVIGHREQGKC